MNAKRKNHIDISLYDDDRFNTVFYEDAWLGEKGKKVAKNHIVDARDYVTVIMAYAQLMIRTHDNESSANYKMFTLK